MNKSTESCKHVFVASGFQLEYSHFFSGREVVFKLHHNFTPEVGFRKEVGVVW